MRVRRPADALFMGTCPPDAAPRVREVTTDTEEGANFPAGGIVVPSGSLGRAGPAGTAGGPGGDGAAAAG
ncbi:hypothetical protein GCM10023088_59630 [Actinomadura verrucosospora]